MNRHKIFNLLLINILLFSTLLAVPTGLKAQDPAPTATPQTGTIPDVGTIPVSAFPGETLKQVTIPLRLQIIADRTGRNMTDLELMNDDQLLEFIEQNSSAVSASSIDRNPVTVTHTETISITAIQKIAARYVVTKNSVSAAIYMPLVTHRWSGGGSDPKPWQPPTLAFTLQELADRLTAADKIQRSLTPPQTLNIPENGCPSESDGTPIWIRKPDGSLLFIGEWDSTGKFDSEVVGIDYEFSTYTFTDQASIWLDRYYKPDGSTLYQISVRTFSGEKGTDIGFGNYWVKENVDEATLPYTVEFTRSAGEFFPTIQYTLRHGCEEFAFRAAQHPGNLNDNRIRSFNAALKLISAGFKDGGVWGATWGQIQPQLDFIFTNEVHAECYADIQTATYRGLNGSAYPRLPYRSKVCIDVPAYVLASTLDPLSLALFAKNIITTKWNPDFEVEWPGPTIGNTTPRNLMNYILDNYYNQGCGIRKLTGPTDVCSGIRTFAMVSLTLPMCYRFHDDRACSYLADASSIYLKVQVGLGDFSQHHVQTEENGNVQRGYAQGAPLVMWKPLEVVSASGTQQIQLAFVKKSTFEQLIDDWFGKPIERKGLSLLSHETVNALIQSVLEWQLYIDPSRVTGLLWIASYREIPIRSDEDWIAIPAATVQTLGSIRSATGANRACIIEKGISKCNNDTLVPNLGVAVYGAQSSFIYTGDAVTEGSASTCAINSSGTICAFPARPNEYAVLTAENLVSIAQHQGCTNVRVVMKKKSDGASVIYPGTNFLIMKEVGYQIFADNDCALTIN